MATIQFTATRNFDAEINGNLCRYVKGQTYTCLDGEMRKHPTTGKDYDVYDDLRKKVKKWAKGGMVKIITKETQ